MSTTEWVGYVGRKRNQLVLIHHEDEEQQSKHGWQRVTRNGSRTRTYRLMLKLQKRVDNGLTISFSRNRRRRKKK